VELAQKTCVPCQGGLPPLKEVEVQDYLKGVPQWQSVEGGRSITRTWRFGDFAQALAFVNKVGALCEAEGHHADLRLGWGYATVIFYTHKINGLHENDFIMAAKVDQLGG
jgi:4a-hydroxytetrahydrobiopterin dehydratase